MELASKGYSRCFVEKQEDIAIVRNVLRILDAAEVEGYMPEDWITVAPAYVNLNENTYLLKRNLVYNGKFRIDVPAFIFMCGRRGVGVIVRSMSQQEAEDKNY